MSHLPAFFGPYGVPRVTLDCDRPTVPPAATALMRLTVANVSGYWVVVWYLYETHIKNLPPLSPLQRV